MSTLTVGGGNGITFGTPGSTGNSGQNISTVSVDSGSTLQVGGNFSQTQGSGGAGASLLSVTNGSTVTVGTLKAAGNFTYSTGFNGNGPQSQVVITGKSNLGITGNLTNVSSGGVLSGGSYLIGNGS